MLVSSRLPTLCSAAARCGLSRCTLRGGFRRCVLCGGDGLAEPSMRLLWWGLCRGLDARSASAASGALHARSPMHALRQPPRCALCGGGPGEPSARCAALVGDDPVEPFMRRPRSRQRPCGDRSWRRSPYAACHARRGTFAMLLCRFEEDSEWVARRNPWGDKMGGIKTSGYTVWCSFTNLDKPPHARQTMRRFSLSFPNNVSPWQDYFKR
jgi:hypothetical protein